MRPLNRPMFKYGGPIKEGIMQGMKEKQAINTVGSPLAPKDETGRGGYALPLLALAPAVATTAARFLAPRVIMGGIRALTGGIRSGRTVSAFDKGIGGMQRLRNLLPTGRFLEYGRKIPLGGKNPRNLPVPYGSTMDATTKLSLRQSLTDPRRLGMAIRENPATAFLAAGQIKNIPDAISGGLGLAADAGLGGVNYLLGTDFSRDKSDIKETEKTDLNRVDKITNVGEVNTDTTESGASKKLSDAEKTKLEEDRIASTKEKYYKLMGVDKLNKQATYDTLIDASNQIREGGTIKDQLKSGNLVSSVINSLSKNLDKSVDLKKQIDAAILKGEITKDIEQSKIPDNIRTARMLGISDKEYRDKILGNESLKDNLIAAYNKQGSFPSGNQLAGFARNSGVNITGVEDSEAVKDWMEANSSNEEGYIQSLVKEGKVPDGTCIINNRIFQVNGQDITSIV